MGLGHGPRRNARGQFKSGRYSSRTRSQKRHRHAGHRSAKWRVVCGKVTRTFHRKKSAANRARPKGCRVARI